MTELIAYCRVTEADGRIAGPRPVVVSLAVTDGAMTAAASGNVER
jgi:hypothetical protein